MNPQAHTDWLPGLLVLSLAFLAGGLYAFFTWKGRGEVHLDGPLADAERKSQKLMDQLRELTVEKHQLTPAQFAAEKERLESEAAQALKERDALRANDGVTATPGAIFSSAPAASTSASGAPGTPVAKGFLGRHPQLAGAVWGSAIVLFFGGVYFTLKSQEKPRGESGVMTGMTPPGSQAPANSTQQLATPEDEMGTALSQLKAHPEDVELAARIGHELIRRRDFQQAQDITTRALGVDPFNSENLAHRAFLKAVFGDEQGGTKDLLHVADVYPDAYEALLFLGMVQMGSGHNPEALAAFERFLKEAPPQEYPPQIAQAVLQLRQQLGAR